MATTPIRLSDYLSLTSRTPRRPGSVDLQVFSSSSPHVSLFPCSTSLHMLQMVSSLSGTFLIPKDMVEWVKRGDEGGREREEPVERAREMGGLVGRVVVGEVGKGGGEGGRELRERS